jgi:hypothetical protein
MINLIYDVDSHELGVGKQLKRIEELANPSPDDLAFRESCLPVRRKNKVPLFNWKPATKLAPLLAEHCYLLYSKFTTPYR